MRGWERGEVDVVPICVLILECEPAFVGRMGNATRWIGHFIRLLE